MNDGESLILPNTLVIKRNRDENIENMLDNSHYKHTGGKMNTNELESYVDVSLGRIIFNRTNIPRKSCQEFKTVARIESGGLYKSKIDNYSIYQYYREDERIGVTLSQRTNICGRMLYRTGIPNVFVLIVEDHEPFLENKRLKVMETDESLLLEAEIRGTINSIELSTDMLYKDINMRICEAQRQLIITSQSLMKRNLEYLLEEKGRTLASHVAGEAAMIHSCATRMVKLRKGEAKCCRELPIWHGEKFEKPGFMKPSTREITSICTPRICNGFTSPLFNIGSHLDQRGVKVDGEEVRIARNPQEFVPMSHNKEEQIVTSKADIFSNQQKAEFKIANFIEIRENCSVRK